MQVDVVRVFTRGPVGGNHLGIVDHLLDDAGMQAVAAEVGYSETIFLDPDASEPRARIFTPATELPFAGHPLVGATWWLGRRGRRPTTLVTGVGPVTVRAADNRAEVRSPLGQPVLERAEAPPGVPPVAACAVVSMPLPYVLCDLGDPGEVASVEPDATWDHVYVYARQSDTVRARFFAGGLGVVEDPATGSAAVALAARLAAAGEATGHLTIHQGEEMGHPSRIDMDWADGAVTIAGTVIADEARQIRRPPGPVRTSTS